MEKLGPSSLVTNHPQQHLRQPSANTAPNCCYPASRPSAFSLRFYSFFIFHCMPSLLASPSELDMALNRRDGNRDPDSQAPLQPQDASSCTLPLRSPRNGAQASNLGDPPLLAMSTGTTEWPSPGVDLSTNPTVTSIESTSLQNTVPEPEPRPPVIPFQTAITVPAPVGVHRHRRRRLKPGCGWCKVKRMRCDDRGPTCRNCERAGKTCVRAAERLPRRRNASSYALGMGSESMPGARGSPAAALGLVEPFSEMGVDGDGDFDHTLEGTGPF
ncbi:hypothetical protein B0T21DRAFT_357719 [Apiosordaria backusii]|uniref:Zn(2)-C6 fungal-type domain-containing protein n=1 Tax=Apiosordaria backusii TaxID=314023 RepID=A0AA40ERU9_9PEZI|nr:hypothetical protein B0T21DRAFT_357719 [Apiosordaria backusii]